MEARNEDNDAARLRLQGDQLQVRLESEVQLISAETQFAKAGASELDYRQVRASYRRGWAQSFSATPVKAQEYY